MSERIVYDIEPIQIDVENRKFLAVPFRLRQLQVQAVDKMCLVRQRRFFNIEIGCIS